MAEALLAISAPELLSFAYETISAAWKLYENVECNQARCRNLLTKCGELVVQTATHFAALSQYDQELFAQRMSGLLRKIEDACLAARATIGMLSNKSFLWRLFHQDKITEELATAEATMTDAFNSFNLGAHISSHQLQAEIAQAQAQDHSDLIATLETIQDSDRKIISMLQESHRGRLRIEELQISILKHIQTIAQAPVIKTPVDTFILQASEALQRVSGKPPPEIPHWTVTSLEVTFDVDCEEDCIGKGGFGNIYKGEWNGQVVAVKEMYSEDARMLDRDNLKYIRHEIMIWSRIAHPHVLPFYCACLEATRPFIVSRYCANGNILEYLRANPSADRISLLHEISLGMAYLHAQGIVHADLKGSNVLVGDDGKALIADFGLSRVQDQVSSATTRTRKMTGTLRWTAPELIEGEAIDKPADVYSFALVAWELYTGSVPYGNIPDRAFYRRVVDKQERPPLPKSIDDGLWALVQQCWVHDPNQRPVFGTIQTQLRAMLLRGRVPSASLSYSGSSLSLGSVSRNPSQTNLSNWRSEPTSEPPSALFENLSLSNGPGTSINTQMTAYTPKPARDISPLVLDSPNKCFLGGLSSSWTEIMLIDLLAQYGNIKSFSLAREKDGASKGYAYFEYTDPSACDMVINALHGTNVSGHILSVHKFNWSAEQNGRCQSGSVPIPAVNLHGRPSLPPKASVGSFQRQNIENPGGWSTPSSLGNSFPSPAQTQLPVAVNSPVELSPGGPMPPVVQVDRSNNPTQVRHQANSSSKAPQCSVHTNHLEDVRSKDVLSVDMDDMWIAVGLSTGGILMYSAVTGDFHNVYIGAHKGGVWCLALGSWPNGRKERATESTSMLLSGGLDRDVKVWDVQHGHCLRVLQGHRSTIRCIKTFTSHPEAITGSRDGMLRTWNVLNGTMVHPLAGHQDSIRDIAIHGRKVATASYDSTCRIWDAKTGRCLQSLCGHVGRVYCIAYNGKRVASGGADKEVRIWDAETGACEFVLREHSDLVGIIRLSADYLVSAGVDGRIVVYAFPTSICHTILAHGQHSIVSLQLAPPHVISGSTDGSVKMFDLDTGEYIRHIGNAGEKSNCPWKFARGRGRTNTWVISDSVKGKASINIWTM